MSEDVDEKTIQMIKDAQWVTVKKYKRFDKIILLTKSGKLEVSLKLRGHLKDFPHLQKILAEKGLKV